MESRPLPEELAASPYRLRLPRAADEGAVVAAVQDPEVPRWTPIPTPYGSEQFRAFRDAVAVGWGKRDAWQPLIVDDGDRPLGGMAAALNWKAGEAEVGYWLAREARGRGVAAHCLRALANWLFDQGFERLQARVLAGNDASTRLLARVGFRHEGTLRSVGGRVCGEFARADIEIHGLLRGELR